MPSSSHLPTPPGLDARLKGYPADAPPLTPAQIGAQGWRVLAGDLPLPLAVLKQAELRHNLGWMQRHVAQAGIALAPHGKTTMSPELFAAQLAAGAWGISFASVHQLALGVAAGVPRALIANQVVQAADLRALAALLQAHPGLQAPFLIDSVAQLAMVEQARLPVALAVLVELGLAGGRTGCRSADEALALARAAHASPAVRLLGLSTYEGLWGQGDDDADRALAEGLMQRLQALASACDAEGLFEGSEILLTSGGSALFDLVSPGLAMRGLSRPVLGLLRSGCYLSHDDGHYRRLVSLANRRLGCPDGQGLQAALQVWTLVQSCPEPGLALLNAGKRDVSFDMGLPRPVAWAPAGALRPQPAPAAWSISGLNDQHAYLRWPIEQAQDAPRVGDRVALGLSHPCTTFDKWRWMAVVDDDLRVVDAITTHF
jgi:D-serine dehydratase